MGLVRIGEFAKRNGVSIDFIRFYEEQGLLTSVVDEHNNYHFFDYSQSETVFKIKYYRQLGFSVKEMVQLFHPSSQDEQIDLYRRKADEQQRIAEQAGCSAQHLLRTADLLSRPDNTWYISQMSAFWFLPHTENGLYLTDPHLQAQLAEWEKQIPFVQSLDHWTLNGDGSLRTVRHGRGIGADMAVKLSVSTESPAMYFPEQRCLEYSFCMKISENNNLPAELNLDFIAPALDVLHSLNLELKNNIFIRPMSFLPEGASTHMKCVVYLPC